MDPSDLGQTERAHEAFQRQTVGEGSACLGSKCWTSKNNRQRALRADPPVLALEAFLAEHDGGRPSLDVEPSMRVGLYVLDVNPGVIDPNVTQRCAVLVRHDTG